MFGAAAVYPAAWWLSMLELPEGQQSQIARGSVSGPPDARPGAADSSCSRRFVPDEGAVRRIGAGRPSAPAGAFRVGGQSAAAAMRAPSVARKSSNSARLWTVTKPRIR